MKLHPHARPHLTPREEHTGIDRDHLRRAVVVSFKMHDRLGGAGEQFAPNVVTQKSLGGPAEQPERRFVMIDNLAKSLVAVFTLAYTAYSQGSYPLHVGDRWDYGQIDMGHYKYMYTESIVGDTAMPNGFTYAIRSYYSQKTYLRQSGDTVF